MAEHNKLGTWGEELAANYLREKGYTIRDTDWKLGKRDLDIVALTPDQRTLVFVEVKTRISDAITKPEDAVDIKKIRSIGYTANSYVKEFDIDLETRFDIISIIGKYGEQTRIEHLEDAFNPVLAY
jgi:putative endonuclease